MFFVDKFPRFVVLCALTFGMLAIGTLQVKAGAQAAAAKRASDIAKLKASVPAGKAVAHPSRITPTEPTPGLSRTAEDRIGLHATKARPLPATPITSPRPALAGHAVPPTAAPITPAKPRFLNDTRATLSSFGTKMSTALKPKPGATTATTEQKQPWYKRQTPEQEAAALAKRHATELEKIQAAKTKALAKETGHLSLVGKSGTQGLASLGKTHEQNIAGLAKAQKTIKALEAKEAALLAKHQKQTNAVDMRIAATAGMKSSGSAALPKISFRDQLKSLNPMDKIRALKEKRAARTAAKKAATPTATTATPAPAVATEGAAAADAAAGKKGFFRNPDGSVNKTRAIGGAALGLGALGGLAGGLAAAFGGSSGDDSNQDAAAMGAPLSADPTQTAGTAYGAGGGNSSTFE